MILFLNGPFGVGRTTVAKALVEKIPDAMLYDPEVIGSVLQRILKPLKRIEDFRDYALWRTLLVEFARLLKGTRGHPLVMPMTVQRREHLDPITAGLRRVDPDLACFRLTAPRDVLVRRILSDSEDEGACAWRMAHVEVCLAAARDPAFGREIRTDGRTPEEVADEIAGKAEPTVPGRQKTITNGGGTSCPR